MVKSNKGREMAESAVKLVIQHLIRLLSQEASLLEGIQKKVANVKDELESIHSFLKDANAKAKMGDMNNVAITWVREKAYHIEDVIDEYILHLAKNPRG